MKKYVLYRIPFVLSIEYSWETDIITPTDLIIMRSIWDHCKVVEKNRKSSTKSTTKHGTKNDTGAYELVINCTN